MIIITRDGLTHCFSFNMRLVLSIASFYQNEKKIENGRNTIAAAGKVECDKMDLNYSSDVVFYVS